MLFNETPPPPKQKMKWEDQEFPYYAARIMTMVLLLVGLFVKSNIHNGTWALKQALECLVVKKEK